ncbi:MAG: succinate dehydrogenase, hydrophobic membrane anchor protein [Rhodospirillaceae bacterium]|nr:succinate dehydrogenase, hydrophobic membrane anchor protein [Rhodospirillaceae bacterium]
MRGRRTRTPLAEARGLGSAKEGAAHWWAQRVTAMALVPLTIWFVGSLLALTGGDHSTFVVWLRSPFNTVVMVVFVVAAFYHMALGLRVVVEDYIHDARIKIFAIAIIQIGCFILSITGIVSIIMVIT